MSNYDGVEAGRVIARGLESVATAIKNHGASVEAAAQTHAQGLRDAALIRQVRDPAPTHERLSGGRGSRTW